jgi:2,3-dihydroxybenzoate decarboxylase
MFNALSALCFRSASATAKKRSIQRPSAGWTGALSRVNGNEVSYRLKRAPSAYLGTNIVFTTSGVASPAALLGAVLEVGADAIMFSVDYPYESSHEAVDGFYGTTLSPSDREKIAHGNAERILKT